MSTAILFTHGIQRSPARFLTGRLPEGIRVRNPSASTRRMKEVLPVKRILLVIVALAAAMLLCLSASADHSVLPKEGDLNETQAVDVMVSFLCEQMNCGEDEVRGHYHYHAIYYPSASWLDDYPGPVWSLVVDSSEPRNDISYADADIDARTGEIINWRARSDWDWAGYEGGLNTYPLIPRKGQVQPHEVIQRARTMLAEAVGPENAGEWQDYNMGADTDQGHFWYRIILGHDNIEIRWPLTFTMWIDADSGEVIWHTDTDRLAFRYGIYKAEGSWTAWYHEQYAAREAEWGPSYTWDYRQHAAFEEECRGIVYWPERQFGMPGASDVSYEAACDAAAAWVAEEKDPTREWQVIGSWFHDNENAWIDDMMRDGIPPEGNRYWEIGFESTEPTLRRFGVMVDPATGEVLGMIGW